MACVSASTPTAAVSDGGIESVSAGSTIAAAQRQWQLANIIFTSRSVSVITITRVASLPVPAVVGTATTGSPARGIFSTPMNSGSGSGLVAWTAIALAQSIELPPPTATRPSQAVPDPG